MENFEEELAKLLNRFSMEQVCDVPDFILATMIRNFIYAIGQPIKHTLDWHGCDSICHPKKQDGVLVEGFTECVWKENSDGYWEAVCGHTWCFEDGGVHENKMKFCPGCGRKVKAVYYESE